MQGARTKHTRLMVIPLSLALSVALLLVFGLQLIAAGGQVTAATGFGEHSPHSLPQSGMTTTTTLYLPTVLASSSSLPPTSTVVATEKFSVDAFGSTISNTLSGQYAQCLGTSWFGLGHNYFDNTYSITRLHLSFPPAPAGVTGLILRLQKVGSINTPFGIEIRQGQWKSAPAEGQVDCTTYWRRENELGPVWGVFTATDSLTNTVDIPLTVAPLENMSIQLTLRLADETTEPAPTGNGIQINEAELLYKYGEQQQERNR